MKSLTQKIPARNYLSPLSKKDRIDALFSDYTSEERECPFYTCDSPNVRSKCLLDPTTWRIWDCRGVCFSQGLCCEQVLDLVFY
jgi:hypothetical protein